MVGPQRGILETSAEELTLLVDALRLVETGGIFLAICSDDRLRDR